jgi:hypothetical protein
VTGGFHRRDRTPRSNRCEEKVTWRISAVHSLFTTGNAFLTATAFLMPAAFLWQL